MLRFAIENCGFGGDACIALHCGQGQQLVWVERTPKAQQPSPGTLVQGTGHMAPRLLDLLQPTLSVSELKSKLYEMRRKVLEA